jgi:DNA-binding transcriptional ArsR family regulator
MEVRDPEALRALAHPVRQRILMQLAVAGHARAADLAAAIGHPANSVSFHLRVLARAGMIREAPEHARDRRDRVWTNVAKSYSVEPDAGDATDTILRPALRWVADVFARRDGDSSDSGGSTDAARQFMLTTVLLTRDQADAMARELADLTTRWAEKSFADARTDPTASRETYQVLSVLAPPVSPRGEEPAGDRRPEAR